MILSINEDYIQTLHNTCNWLIPMVTISHFGRFGRIFVRFSLPTIFGVQVLEKSVLNDMACFATRKLDLTPNS